MELKKLTKKEQLALLKEKNRVELVQQYVSYAGAFMKVAEYKVMQDILEYRRSKGVKAKDVHAALACMGELKDEKELEVLKILSLQEARELYYSSRGILYPEVLKKIISDFPRKVSKEILLTYIKSCDLKEETLWEVLNVYNKKDAKEILLAAGLLSGGVMRKMSELYSKKEMKEFMAELIDTDAPIDDDVQFNIIDMFSKKDAKELFEKAMDHDVEINEGMLEYIICTFSKKAAKEMLTKYFEGCGKKYFEDWYISDMLYRL